MRKVLAPTVAAIVLALLAAGVLPSLWSMGRVGQAPAAQPPTLTSTAEPLAQAQPSPTATPCTPMFLTPGGPVVEYKAPPNAPPLPPELLTPIPLLPPECAEQMSLGTPWPHEVQRPPDPWQLTPGPPVTPDPTGPIYTTVFEESWWWRTDPSSRGPITTAVSIAIGTVKERLPARWATADGKKPPNVYPGSPDFDPPTHPEQAIFTPVVFQVEEYLKNPQPEKTLTLRLVGGKVGRDVFSVHSTEEYLLRPGKRVLVFLDHFISPSQERADVWRPFATCELLLDGTVVTGMGTRFPLLELREAIAAASGNPR